MKDLLKAYEKDILKDGFTVHEAGIRHHRAWYVHPAAGVLEYDPDMGMQIINF